MELLQRKGNKPETKFASTRGKKPFLERETKISLILVVNLHILGILRISLFSWLFLFNNTSDIIEAIPPQKTGGNTVFH